MTSYHYQMDREQRNKLIKEIGIGNPVARFEVDKGHKNGAEIHVITDTGLIAIYNLHTRKFITVLIARPSQIKRYYMNSKKKPSKALLDLAFEHQKLGYNNL